MKKIGIITLSDNNNIGNRLQNYATTYIFKKMGYKPYTIWIYNTFNAQNIKQYIKYLRKKIKDIFIKRRRKIKSFNKYLNIYSQKIIKNNDIYKIYDDFDCLVVGSDQVWNYKLMNNYNIFLLKDYTKEKISISASFGEIMVPDYYKKELYNSLSKFKAISVREEEGKKLINSIKKDLDVTILVDPTMALTKEEWDKVSEKPKILKSKKYILTYFLGNLTELQTNEINNYAKENDCEIVDLMNKNSKYYNISPSEFIYLEKNAYLIFTDSFHSCVFAILYNTPFIVYYRNQKNVNMNSRIDTLLQKFNLKKNVYTGEINRDKLILYKEEVKKKITEEREKLYNFLKKSL